VVVEKSVLVGYSAEQMFSLIDAIDAYPQFLPWCAGAKVSHRDSQITRATLHVDYRGVRQSFTTENRKTAPHRIAMHLVEGPFRSLDGDWVFKALGNAACKIDFRLQYEFSTRLLETLIGPVFSHIADTMVDAFVRRAEALHGS
jgi:ribosome-associated toxin RatA of RatAB toxin-antitoxin module